MISLIDRMKTYSDWINRPLYFKEMDNPTQEELFLLWVAEAVLLGIIKNYVPEDEIDKFILFEGLSYDYTIDKILYEGTKKEELKVITKAHKLLHPTTYTPDGVIEWDPKYKNILFNDLFEKGDAYFKAQLVEGRWITILDVKAPTGTNRESDLPFSFTRKMMWMSHKLYVNKVMIVPPKMLDKGYLYKETWTPSRYFLTDKMTKERTLHYHAKRAEEFISNL